MDRKDDSLMLKTNFWNFLFELRFKTVYMKLYQTFCKRVIMTINIISAITASSGIGGWWIWSQIPWVWTILVGASELLQIIKSILPFEKRIDYANEIIPGTTTLVLDMEAFWIKNFHLEENDSVWSEVTAFMKKYYDLENQCTNKEYFVSNNKKWAAEAKRQCEEHLKALKPSREPAKTALKFDSAAVRQYLPLLPGDLPPVP